MRNRSAKVTKGTEVYVRYPVVKTLIWKSGPETRL